MDNTTVSYRPLRRHFRFYRTGALLQDAKEYVKKNRKVLTVIAIACFLFYWYELRPIQMNHTCAAQASVNARVLLQSKADVAQDAEKRQAYQSLLQQNLYLRSDYESFYKKCLREYGVNL